MGLTARFFRKDYDTDEVDLIGEVKQGAGSRCAVRTRIAPPRKQGDHPEIWFNIDSPETKGKVPWGSTVQVRIHGVTVRHLINDLIKHPEILPYLTSAVDHLRANPGDFATDYRGADYLAFALL
jgi:hypothetical protein